MKSFIKWFELNLGWFFINGRKQNDWTAYLRNKYKDDRTRNNRIGF
jgi:hypothetical protein